MLFDGEFIWVTWEHGHVTKSELDGTRLCDLDGFTNPKGLGFDGNDIWVANYGGNTIAKVRRGCEITPSITHYPALNKPYAVVYDGEKIWVTLEQLPLPPGGGVMWIDAAGQPGGPRATGTNPHGAAFDGRNIWVANSGSNTITKLRADLGSIVGTYPVGTLPEAVIFDGINIWVSNSGSNSLTRFF